MSYWSGGGSAAGSPMPENEQAETSNATTTIGSRDNIGIGSSNSKVAPTNTLSRSNPTHVEMKNPARRAAWRPLPVCAIHVPDSSRAHCNRGILPFGKTPAVALAAAVRKTQARFAAVRGQRDMHVLHAPVIGRVAARPVAQ